MSQTSAISGLIGAAAEALGGVVEMATEQVKSVPPVVMGVAGAAQSAVFELAAEQGALAMQAAKNTVALQRKLLDAVFDPLLK